MSSLLFMITNWGKFGRRVGEWIFMHLCSFIFWGVILPLICIGICRDYCGPRFLNKQCIHGFQVLTSPKGYAGQGCLWLSRPEDGSGSSQRFRVVFVLRTPHEQRFGRWAMPFISMMLGFCTRFFVVGAFRVSTMGIHHIWLSECFRNFFPTGQKLPQSQGGLSRKKIWTFKGTPQMPPPKATRPYLKRQSQSTVGWIFPC